MAERLRLNYGSRCSLEFHSVLGRGTRAVVTIPLEARDSGPEIMGEGEN